MKNRLLIYWFSFLLISCATPISPTGGPADKTPPKLISVTPADQTTLFDGNKIEFEFDEYVTQASARKAFKIEPDLDIDYKIQFSGKRIKIKLSEKLPSKTTAVIGFDNQLSDTRGNKITKPIQIALSADSIINTGEIKIKVLNHATGMFDRNVNCFLFAETQDITEKAIYTSESDTGGTVNFKYLPSGRYKMAIVNDINRNKIWDSFEWSQPIYENAFEVFQDSTTQLKTAYYFKPDTVQPELQAIGVLTNNRLRLRFSEPVFPSNTKRFIAKSDSSAHFFHLLYSEENANTTYYAQTSDELIPELEFEIDSLQMIDAQNNPLILTNSKFESISQKDTTLQRVLSIQPENNVIETDSIKIVYSTFVSQMLIDSLKLVVQNEVLDSLSTTAIENNELLFWSESGWSEQINYQVRAFNPSTLNYISQDFKSKNIDELGSISIQFDSSLVGEKYVQLVGNVDLKTIVTSDSVASFSNLRESKYILRTFLDVNENGKWDSGTLKPYVKPEPFFIKSNLNISTNSDGILTIEF